VRTLSAVFAESATRDWSAPPAYDLPGTLAALRRGPYDPCCRIEGGTVWRVARTPRGPVTLHLTSSISGGTAGDTADLPSGDTAEPSRTVRARAWGPGAQWALAQLPALLGAEDDPTAFTAHHRLTRHAQRRHAGLRLARTGLVMESLIPSVLEQKVTTQEAYRAWRLLVRRHGERAPGPRDDLYVMPEPRQWCRIPSWEWHRAGVDSKRSATVIRAARRAPRLEEAAGMELPDALTRLQLIPGIGPWTAAETLQRSNGDPDAITIGDLHLPRIVGYSLTGARDTDDAGMLELLAPYEGQRHRAARFIMLTGSAPPRREPRMPIRDIARL
jgi:3-methyladenine DNA glycosylase/8-oxoguanine DNA glycosylase